MSYRSGLQMFAIMTNWKSEFHKPLTRPGVKHDEEMSISSSTPQAHRGYINSSLLESDLKMSESHANVVSFDENGRFYTRDALPVWTSFGKHFVIRPVIRL